MVVLLTVEYKWIFWFSIRVSVCEFGVGKILPKWEISSNSAACLTSWKNRWRREKKIVFLLASLAHCYINIFSLGLWRKFTHNDKQNRSETQSYSWFLNYRRLSVSVSNQFYIAKKTGLTTHNIMSMLCDRI